MADTKPKPEAIIELRETRPASKVEGVAILEGENLSNLNQLLSQIKNQGIQNDKQTKKPA